MAKAKPTSKAVTFENVAVVFSHLAELDTSFNNKEHPVTIAIENEAKKLLNKIHTEFGKTRKLAGHKVSDEYGEQLKIKTNLHSEMVSFPEIYDEKVEKTTSAPQRGDLVNVNAMAKQTEAGDKKYISFYLNEIQFSERNGGAKKPFEIIKSDSEEDLPF